MLYLVGIIITFFLALLLASKKGRTTADSILTIWLVVIGVHLTAYYFFVTGLNYTIPYALGVEIPIPLLHGPLLYLYTGAVTGKSESGKRWLLHFVPIVISYLLLSRFLMLPADEKILIYEAKGKGYEMESAINFAMIILSGIIYVALCLRLLHRHKQNLQNQFSYTTRISLAWLRYLIIGIGLIWLSVMFGNETSTFSLAVGLVVFIGYFGINQVGIFTQQQVRDEHVVPMADKPETPALATFEGAKKEKYTKSGLNDESGRKLHQALSQAMTEKRLYTNPELTLADLAKTLDTNPNNLSQVINTLEGKSFYDYINLKRVEEFKRCVCLPENQKFTLLSIAQDCGFNSKTSFNRNFKNVTGLSPTEYLKQANILLEQ